MFLFIERDDRAKPDLKAGPDEVLSHHVIKGKGKSGEGGQEWRGVLIEELIGH